MRFSLARLWPSPPRQAPELVHESGSDDDDDDPLNTPHSSSKRPSPQVRVVEQKTVPMGEIYLDEDSPFINRNIDEVPQTIPSSGSKYRELLYVAKVEDLTETLKQVSEESKGYQEELDQERKTNTLEMARVKRQLEEERKELEAVKARLLEERTRREAVEAQVERLRVLLDDEKIAHGETKAELEVVRLQLDRAQNEEEEEEGDEDDSELRGYFYRSASEVFSAKAPMGSGRKETFCLYNGSIYRTRPGFDDILSRLTKPYVLYSGHERRVPQLESTIKKLPTCKSANKHHFFDMRGTNGYKRHYKCDYCGFFEKESQ